MTGGSSGLGLRMVHVLAAHGAHVISISRSHAGEIQCPSGDGGVLEIMADVTRPDEIVRAFDEGERRFGRIEALFNNAGVAHMARALDTTRDMLEHIFEVNVAGAFRGAGSRAPDDRKRQGRSHRQHHQHSGRTAAEGAAAYSMSKACVTQMTRALALEWAAHNIRVNAISPGWFPTRINEEQLQGLPSYLKGRNPMRRLGSRRILTASF